MIGFTVDQEKCTRCGECVADCPYGVLALSPEYPAVVEENEEKCIRCQHCLAVCPTGAVSILGKDPANSLSLRGHFPSAEQMEYLIKGRRSVRRFKEEPVEPEVIAKMLEIISYSPTGRNNRQHLYTIIDDPAIMQKVKQATMEGVRESLITDNIPSGLEFFDRLLLAWDQGKDVVFRNAPHMLIVSAPADGVSPVQDTMISLSYFELLAQSMGLGTLWDGLAYGALNAIVPDMKEKLGIPEDHLIGYTMVFGKPAVKYSRTVQRDTARVNRVSWSE